MADIIHLLPDNIANQIAAGEVIQRPSSAVKELLENAVDAGATEIKLIITDAGKSLVQVTDNGKGMSETDARMSFERHATSKIQGIEDLFRIKTMGFRGEALASVAAVAQVELKTRRAEDELGTLVIIENSMVLKQEPCACPIGTTIAMKNLFFSIPARRNFLKSNAAEMRHIVDEFIRVAMAFPNIFFSLICNGQQTFHLESGNLKQRVVQILGNQYAAKLVTVKEEMDYMNVYGFVGKPETAKKTRGDQYFFVNSRFIKSSYLNHAVNAAYNEMIAKDSFPSYALFIDIDPSVVDINVHPTKQEIKFEDEKIIYAFVKAAVQHALAQFSISPSLDFSLDAHWQNIDAISKPFTNEQKAQATSSNLYHSFTQKHQAHTIEPTKKSELQHWQSFLAPPQSISQNDNNVAKIAIKNFEEAVNASLDMPFHAPAQSLFQCLQLFNTYIATITQNGLVIVHQQLAHERILYEKFAQIASKNGKGIVSQKTLFPVNLEMLPADAMLLEDILPELKQIGYDIEPNGERHFLIQGTPADVPIGNEQHSIELLIEQFKHFSSQIQFSKREKLIRCLARQQAIKAGQTLQPTEMQALVAELFSCNTPNVTPTGSPTYINLEEGYLDTLFQHGQ